MRHPVPVARLDAELLRDFLEPPGLLGAVETVEQTLRRLAGLCARAFPVAAVVGISLRSGTMWAATTVPESHSAMDQQQYALGAGPALDVVRDNTPSLARDLATEQRWAGFCAVAVEHGLRSLLVAPLSLGGVSVGALSLYAEDVGAVDDHDTIARTEELTVHVGATLLNARAQETVRRQADHLRTALDSRASIEQAKGVLMGREGCSPDEAFRLLRYASQTQHLKLHEVAARVLAAARDPQRP